MGAQHHVGGLQVAVQHPMGVGEADGLGHAPKDLEGRRALVEIRPAEFENAEGQVVRRNEVPYDGYRALPETGSADGEVPF